MLAAAHALFSANGYKATTTKEISIRAHVAEPTLFRNFGSKAELFEATILEPFTDFIAAWTSSWNQLSADDPLPDLAESLVGGLFKLVRQDRKLFQELITARADPHNDLHQSAVSISTQLRDGLRAVEDVGLAVAEARGLAALDAPATIVSVASMVIGSVLLEDWVTPSGTRKLSQARMIREMTALVTYGITERPTGPAVGEAQPH
jgi:AcrR family transcriptional regulator